MIERVWSQIVACSHVDVDSGECIWETPCRLHMIVTRTMISPSNFLLRPCSRFIVCTYLPNLVRLHELFEVGTFALHNAG